MCAAFEGYGEAFVGARNDMTHDDLIDGNYNFWRHKL